MSKNFGEGLGMGIGEEAGKSIEKLGSSIKPSIQTLSKGVKKSSFTIVDGLAILGGCAIIASIAYSGKSLWDYLFKPTPTDLVFKSIKALPPIDVLWKDKLSLDLPRFKWTSTPLSWLYGSHCETNREMHIVSGGQGCGKSNLILRWAVELERKCQSNAEGEYKGHKFIYVSFKNKEGITPLDIIIDAIHAPKCSIEVLKHAIIEYKKKEKKRLVLILDDYQHALDPNADLNKLWLLCLAYDDLADLIFIFSEQVRMNDFYWENPYRSISLNLFEEPTEVEFVNYLKNAIKSIPKVGGGALNFNDANAMIFYRTIGGNFNELKRLYNFLNDETRLKKDLEIREVARKQLASQSQIFKGVDVSSVDIDLIGFIQNEAFICFRKLANVIEKTNPSKEIKETIFRIFKSIMNNEKIYNYASLYNEFRILEEANMINRDLYQNCWLYSFLTRTMFILCIEDVNIFN